MTDRQLLEAINEKLRAMDSRIEVMDSRIETMDSRMNSMGDQIGQLVRHVGEVRQTNVRLETGMREMRGDIQALDTKLETKTNFLVSKIDHFVEHFSIEQTRERTQFEEERHLRSYSQAKTDERLDAIEQRLEHLEASSS